MKDLPTSDAPKGEPYHYCAKCGVDFGSYDKRYVCEDCSTTWSLGVCLPRPLVPVQQQTEQAATSI